MPCGSCGQGARLNPSGLASSSWANCQVLFLVALVRIADNKCDVPVLYSTRVPGSSIRGCASTYLTQFLLRTHAPYWRPLVESNPDRMVRRSSIVMPRF